MQIPLSKIDDLILAEARRAVLQFNRASARVQDFEGTLRDTFNFGHDFNKLKHANFSQTAIPKFLKDVCVSAISGLEQATGERLPEASSFTNCIVSFYDKGYRLQPHIDAVREDRKPFYFGDKVIGVILEADSSGRFYIQRGKGKIRPVFNAKEALIVPEENGLAFLMEKDLRVRPNYHGVSEVEARRISVTYRTVERNIG